MPTDILLRLIRLWYNEKHIPVFWSDINITIPFYSLYCCMPFPNSTELLCNYYTLLQFIFFVDEELIFVTISPSSRKFIFSCYVYETKFKAKMYTSD